MTSESNQPQKTPRPVHLLKRLRDEIGKTQLEMAKMVGASLSLWKKMETGRSISWDMALRIGRATGVSATELYERPYGCLLQTAWKYPYTRKIYEAYLDKEHFRFSGPEAFTNKSNRDPLLSVEDLADADLLRSKLRRGSLFEFLKEKLSPATLAKISCEWEKEASKEALREDLNRIIGEKEVIYDDDRFDGIPLSVETAELLDQWYKKEKQVSGMLLNRMLLEDAFPQELNKLRENTIPPEARAEAGEVGELATCMVLAAASRGKPLEKAIHAAICQALEEIRKEFDLEFLTFEQFVKRTSKAVSRGVRPNEQTGKEEWRYWVARSDAPGLLLSEDPKVRALAGWEETSLEGSDASDPHASDHISLPPYLQKKGPKLVPRKSPQKGKGVKNSMKETELVCL